MMGPIFFAIIAVCYLVATLDFIRRKDWPWVLVSFGCFLVLVGNVWAMQRDAN